MNEVIRSRVDFKKLRRFSQSALEKGALHTKIISTKTIITAPWVRLKCQYFCENFGKNVICPPNAPNYNEMKSILGYYDRAILVHGSDKSTVTRIALETEKESYLSGFYRAFALGAGPCKLSPDDVIPEIIENNSKSRPLMEAVGIDVFQTARNNGFRIEILYSPDIRPHYFSLILIE